MRVRLLARLAGASLDADAASALPDAARPPRRRKPAGDRTAEEIAEDAEIAERALKAARAAAAAVLPGALWSSGGALRAGVERVMGASFFSHARPCGRRPR